MSSSSSSNKKSKKPNLLSGYSAPRALPTTPPRPPAVPRPPYLAKKSTPPRPPAVPRPPFLAKKRPNLPQPQQQPSPSSSSSSLPRKKHKPSSSNMIFHNCKILFMGSGSYDDLTPTRAETLTSLVKQNGGKVRHQLTHAHKDRYVTHIVISTKGTAAYYEQQFNNDESVWTKYHVVSPEWVSTSMMKRQRQFEEAFTVIKPSPIAASITVATDDDDDKKKLPLLSRSISEMEAEQVRAWMAQVVTLNETNALAAWQSAMDDDEHVSLLCPLTCERIVTQPVRGRRCSHLACFDLRAWLVRFVGRLSEEWRCPHCQMQFNAQYGDVVIDPVMRQVLNTTDPSIQSLSVADALASIDQTHSPPLSPQVDLYSHDHHLPLSTYAPDEHLPATYQHQIPTNTSVDQARHTYACQPQPSASPSTTLALDERVNHNTHLTGPLQEMLAAHKAGNPNQYRVVAYRKVIDILKQQPYRIGLEHLDRLQNIKGIGPKFAAKLREILTSGTMQKLEILKTDPRIQVMKIFTRIWGVGQKMAEQYYNEGHRTLDDLRNRKGGLPRRVAVTIDCYDDLLVRIPRVEVAWMESFIRDEAEKMLPGVAVACCGSYRRGKLDSGDCDVIFTHPDPARYDDLFAMFERLVRHLSDIKFLLHHLTDNFPPSEFGHLSYMGICMVPSDRAPEAIYSGIKRRIDLKCYPVQQFAFALLYFTGSDYFNRSMRLFASRKGYVLSDHGLAKGISSGEKDNIHQGLSEHCYTERDIFDALGLVYVHPKDREVYEKWEPVAASSNTALSSLYSSSKKPPLVKTSPATKKTPPVIQRGGDSFRRMVDPTKILFYGPHVGKSYDEVIRSDPAYARHTLELDDQIRRTPSSSSSSSSSLHQNEALIHQFAEYIRSSPYVSSILASSSSQAS